MICCNLRINRNLGAFDGSLPSFKVADDFGGSELLMSQEFGRIPDDVVKKYTTVWVGAPSGITTSLHYDLPDNFYTQIRGQKRFTLAPPSEHAHARLFPMSHPSNRQSQVDPIGEEAFSRMKRDVAFLNPGDLLFIPSLTLHMVETVSAPSISVMLFFLSRHTEAKCDTCC